MCASALAAARCARLLPRLLPHSTGSALRGSTLQPAGTLLHPARAGGGSSAATAARARCHSGSASSNASSSSSPANASTAAGASDKKRVVFCGTPEVAALVLRRLLAAAAQPDSSFEVAAVVTQPPRPTGRGRKAPQPSPVELAAEAAGLLRDRILAPERPGESAFLETLRSLAPDLCVTAAYGNYLPSSFLAVPPHGTLNIHPSLLPAYRGAAPVQRALEDGLRITGVTVLYTVKAMDAGPILAQQKLPVDPDIQAPELLDKLFELGTDLLVGNLENVWAGLGPLSAQPQDDAAATHAPKLTREEAILDFRQSAQACHNKVRGFAGWPGTFATFRQSGGGGGGGSSSSSSDSGDAADMELKVVRTTLAEPSAWRGGDEREVAATKEGLFIRCGDGSVLQVLEVQVPGKRAMAAKDFVNGMKGRTLSWVPAAAAAAAAGAAA